MVSDQSARKAKIIRLESLAHCGIHSHLIIISQNGGISLKYWGGLEPFSPPGSAAYAEECKKLTDYIPLLF